jgi:adenosylcobinamide-phosphate synthase
VTVSAWELAAGITLDAIFGDPRWMPHPISGAGWLVARAEAFWRRTQVPPRVAGVLLWASVASVSTAFVWVTLPWLNVYWIWVLLAARGLDRYAANVVDALERGDISDARAKLAMIVGRDTENLDESGILRAVVETMSENTSDAVVAPLLYLLIGGPAAMAFYKTVNTMDSMIGYRNERYREFGWCAARMDDVLNFVPARLTAVLVWISACFTGLDVRRSFRVTLRDARSQPSPNAGYPEAAYAGALGIRLGGVSTYSGMPSRKAYLGDGSAPLKIDTFTRARKLLVCTFVLAAAVSVVVAL